MAREVAPRRLRDVPAPAVVGGDGQREPRVARGQRLAGGDELADARRRTREVSPIDPEADAVLVQLRRLPARARARTGPSGSRPRPPGGASSRSRTRTASGTRRRARCRRFTIARTASTPLRWPATRGSSRCFAQRPLPSMMMATWRGTSPRRGDFARGAREQWIARLNGRSKSERRSRRRRAASDRHQVRFLRRRGPCRSRR